jgi:hypothetical protein
MLVFCMWNKRSFISNFIVHKRWPGAGDLMKAPLEMKIPEGHVLRSISGLEQSDPNLFDPISQNLTSWLHRSTPHAKMIALCHVVHKMQIHFGSLGKWVSSEHLGQRSCEVMNSFGSVCIFASIIFCQCTNVIKSSNICDDESFSNVEVVRIGVRCHVIYYLFLKIVIINIMIVFPQSVSEGWTVGCLGFRIPGRDHGIVEIIFGDEWILKFLF